MKKKKILKALNNCSLLCNSCSKECLDDPDIEMKARCIELTRECAVICQVTESMLAHDSENTNMYLLLCGEICEITAEECEKFEQKHCNSCAHICRKCSELLLLGELVN